MGEALGCGILEEVRGFLSDLRRDWPDLFAVCPPPVHPRARRTARPVAKILPAIPAPPPPAGSLAAIFHDRASHWALRMGVDFGRVRVKDQRSLWGSCSREGNLNFNWRLTLAPFEILDYVVVHELAHRLEMNHSRRFWAHVEIHVPDHRRHRRWLRQNGEALYRGERPQSARDFTMPAASSGANPDNHSPLG